MDAARQIVRWSIPGSIFFLNLIASQTLVDLANNVSLAEALGPISRDFNVLVAAVAGVPVGYLVYQFYFWQYTPFFFGRFPRIDRGAEIMSVLTAAERSMLATQLRTEISTDEVLERNSRSKILKLLRFNNEVMSRYPSTSSTGAVARFTALRRGHSRELHEYYSERFDTNWAACQSFLDLLGNLERCSHIRYEYTQRSDIYHSLGAVRTAVTCSAAIFFGYNAAFHTEYFGHRSSLAAIAGIVIASSGTLYVCHTQRRRSWKLSAKQLRGNIAWAVPLLMAHLLTTKGAMPVVERIPQPSHSPE